MWHKSCQSLMDAYDQMGIILHQPIIKSAETRAAYSMVEIIHATYAHQSLAASDARLVSLPPSFLQELQLCCLFCLLTL